MSRATRAAEADTDAWEKRKLSGWKRRGLLTEAGGLRVPRRHLRLHSLSILNWRRRQRMSLIDAVDALILVDGVIPRGFMAANERVRKTIQDIVDDRLVRVLTESVEFRALLYDVAFEALTEMESKLGAERDVALRVDDEDLSGVQDDEGVA